mmetsp:Transcript_111820/g.280109  ORF Transcript_111820/g.280109 Transcript_111820/m.280109 type:complete len:218 (-) Transcript_111820:298-951(-)
MFLYTSRVPKSSRAIDPTCCVSNATKSDSASSRLGKPSRSNPAWKASLDNTPSAPSSSAPKASSSCPPHFSRRNARSATRLEGSAGTPKSSSRTNSWRPIVSPMPVRGRMRKSNTAGPSSCADTQPACIKPSRNSSRPTSHVNSGTGEAWSKAVPSPSSAPAPSPEPSGEPSRPGLAAVAPPPRSPCPVPVSSSGSFSISGITSLPPSKRQPSKRSE